MAKKVYFGVEPFAKRDLPTGYTQLQYIESSGTQYINTEYKATTNNMRIDIKAEYLSVATGQSLFGVQNSSGSLLGIVPYTKQVANPQLYVGSSHNILGVNISVGVPVTWSITAKNGIAIWSYDGGSDTASYADSLIKDYPYFLLANNLGGTASQFCSARLHYFKIYDNDVLVRDYVPCTTAWGEIGLYDLANAKFYGNYGSGSFIAGRPVSLPSGYTELSYIQTSGTQYIDSGIGVPCSVEATLQGVTATSNYSVVLSAGTEEVAGRWFAFNSSGWSIWENSFPTAYNQKITVNCEWTSANLTATINGVTRSRSATIAGNICVGSPWASFPVNCKIYELKIYVNGTLVRYFIPCVAGSGVIGLLDVVNNQFYSNAGSGVFIAGPEVESLARNVKKMYFGKENFTQRVLPSGYTQLEYIQSSGTEYINTGFIASGGALRVVTKFRYTTSHDTLSLFGHQTRPYSITPYGSRPQFYVGQTSAGINCGPQTSLGVDYVLDVTADNGSLTALWDGVKYTATYATPINTSTPIFLFGSNSNGSLAESGNGYQLKYLQIYDSGVLVRDYVPCVTVGGEVGLYDLVNAKFYGNDGTGKFIAGDYHASVARNIKKAYIGIGSVARPFWGGGELAYYGAITPLSVVRMFAAATENSNYALFGGGAASTMGGVSNSSVDAYNSSLTRSNPSELSSARAYLAASTIGKYSLFGGGIGVEANASAKNTLDVYDTSLTKQSSKALSVARYNVEAITNGGYALFAGGTMDGNTTDYATVDAFNSSLTRSKANDLSDARSFAKPAVVGDYAIFAGGQNGQSPYYSSVVDAYSSSLTKVASVSALSSVMSDMATATIGGYALFAGGYNGTYRSSVTVYDASLTRTNPVTLSTARNRMGGVALGGYAIFGGGQNSNVVDVFDEKLTRTLGTPLSAARNLICTAIIGNYALFGGGNTSAGGTVVDAFTIV